MKIWITRDTATSIQFGGLERLQVWFRKPEFLVKVLTEKDRDTPFGDIGEDEGYYCKYGWYAGEKFGIRSLSFGNWLGYGEGEHGEIAQYVWNKLKEHFHNAPFENWDKVEREDKCKQENFLLELEIDIKLKL